MQKQYNRNKKYTPPPKWYANTSTLLNLIVVLLILNIFFGLML